MTTVLRPRVRKPRVNVRTIFRRTGKKTQNPDSDRQSESDSVSSSVVDVELGDAGVELSVDSDFHFPRDETGRENDKRKSEVSPPDSKRKNLRKGIRGVSSSSKTKGLTVLEPFVPKPRLTTSDFGKEIPGSKSRKKSEIKHASPTSRPIESSKDIAKVGLAEERPLAKVLQSGNEDHGIKVVVYDSKDKASRKVGVTRLGTNESISVEGTNIEHLLAMILREALQLSQNIFIRNDTAEHLDTDGICSPIPSESQSASPAATDPNASGKTTHEAPVVPPALKSTPRQAREGSTLDNSIIAELENEESVLPKSLEKGVYLKTQANNASREQSETMLPNEIQKHLQNDSRGSFSTSAGKRGRGLAHSRSSSLPPTSRRSSSKGRKIDEGMVQRFFGFGTKKPTTKTDKNSPPSLSSKFSESTTLSRISMNEPSEALRTDNATNDESQGVKTIFSPVCRDIAPLQESTLHDTDVVSTTPSSAHVPAVGHFSLEQLPLNLCQSDEKDSKAEETQAGVETQNDLYASGGSKELGELAGPSIAEKTTPTMGVIKINSEKGQEKANLSSEVAQPTQLSERSFMGEARTSLLDTFKTFGDTPTQKTIDEALSPPGEDTADKEQHSITRCSAIVSKEKALIAIQTGMKIAEQMGLLKDFQEEEKQTTILALRYIAGIAHSSSFDAGTIEHQKGFTFAKRGNALEKQEGSGAHLTLRLSEDVPDVKIAAGRHSPDQTAKMSTREEELHYVDKEQISHPDTVSSHPTVQTVSSYSERSSCKLAQKLESAPIQLRKSQNPFNLSSKWLAGRAQSSSGSMSARKTKSNTFELTTQQAETTSFEASEASLSQEDSRLDESQSGLGSDRAGSTSSGSRDDLSWDESGDYDMDDSTLETETILEAITWTPSLSDKLQTVSNSIQEMETVAHATSRESTFESTRSDRSLKSALSVENGYSQTHNAPLMEAFVFYVESALEQMQKHKRIKQAKTKKAKSLEGDGPKYEPSGLLQSLAMLMGNRGDMQKRKKKGRQCHEHIQREGFTSPVWDDIVETLSDDFTRSFLGVSKTTLSEEMEDFVPSRIMETHNE